MGSKRRIVPRVAFAGVLAVLLGDGYWFSWAGDKVAALGFGVTALGVILGGMQLWLAEHQDQILTRQDSEMHQKARLVLWAETISSNWPKAMRIAEEFRDQVKIIPELVLAIGTSVREPRANVRSSY